MDLCGGDPLNVVMLQFLRDALCDGYIEQSQMHREIGIFVDNVHKDVADREGNGKLLPALTNECLIFCFAGFNLAANKLPQ